MKDRRNIAFCLALLMLSSALCGCGETETEEDTTVSTETEPIVTVEDTVETQLSCSVPAELVLDGSTVTFLQFTDTPNINISVEEQTGELLNDAMYAANSLVMEDLDCVFAHIDNNGIETTNLQKAFTAGEDTYDIVYGTQWKVAPLVAQHLFANLNTSAGGYIDFEKPWWYGKYIDETEVDKDHTYFLAGDASPDVMRRSSMMILNTDMLTNIGGNVEEIYTTVLEGNWTFDVLSALVESLYIDSDGDGQRTEADTFGFATWTRSDVDHFMIGAGIRGCSRDGEGVPYITFHNETTVRFVETLCNFLWNNEGAYYVEQIPSLEMMANGQAMFLCEKFSRLDLVRDVEANFTILPMPKLDDTISSYSSLVHDDALILCVPVVHQSVEVSTAVMEKLAYTYYYDVMPQYYDVILKTKYRRDSSDVASQIMDVIHESMTTDFTYIYNYGMSNMLISLRDLIGVSKSTDFASAYAKNEKAYQQSLEELIEAIRGE